MLLASGGTRTFRPLMDRHPEVIGAFLVPRAWNRLPDGVRWAADNDAFNGFHEGRFLHMLERLAYAKDRCVFVPCPDVVHRVPDATKRPGWRPVGDHAATLVLFDQWEPRLHADGWPVAFVAQDGCAPDLVPWDRLEAIFIGGSDEFKESHTVRLIAARAKLLGKWVHMGRVNGADRLRWAKSIKCDSVDGSGFSKHSEEMWADYGHFFLPSPTRYPLFDRNQT